MPSAIVWLRRSRYVHATQGVALLLLATICVAPPVHAAASMTVIDTTRTAWAFINPASVAQWRGVVQVHESTVSDGRTSLNRNSGLSMNLWRRACDVTGCVESVMSAVNVPATSVAWSDGLASARISVSAAPVRVQRFRVGDSALTPLDDLVMMLPIAVAMNRTASEFAQTSTARTAGLVTTSKTLRVRAASSISVGSLTISADESSLTQSSSLTTASAKARR